MADIEFRLRRSEDDFEPYYVRIAEAGDGTPLAFTDNDETEEAGDTAIATLRARGTTSDTMYDRSNDVWFFRLKSSEGDILFRSMPLATEHVMHDTIHRILTQAGQAPIINDRRP